MNKYTIWYQQITTNAKQRIVEGYTEKHHITPKSLGGLDELDNLVNLTAREHFICHWLLTKIYPTGEEHWKMINAFRMMRAENPRQQRYKSKITARVYDKLKTTYSELQSRNRKGIKNGFYGKHHTNEVRQRISKANKGRVQPLDEKEKQIKAITGKKRTPFSEEWRANLSKNHKSKKGYDCSISDETRKKISEQLKGRKQDPTVVKARAEKIKGSKREKIQCPHCQQDIAVNVYSRWHGDKCKLRKEEG